MLNGTLMERYDGGVILGDGKTVRLGGPGRTPGSATWAHAQQKLVVRLSWHDVSDALGILQCVVRAFEARPCVIANRGALGFGSGKPTAFDTGADLDDYYGFAFSSARDRHSQPSFRWPHEGDERKLECWRCGAFRPAWRFNYPRREWGALATALHSISNGRRRACVPCEEHLLYIVKND